MVISVREGGKERGRLIVDGLRTGRWRLNAETSSGVDFLLFTGALQSFSSPLAGRIVALIVVPWVLVTVTSILWLLIKKMD